jgi:murein DD-endopeptidase MepM/ murein hydrolase activator NlpD
MKEMARVWNLHTVRGLAATGTVAGLTLASGAIGWELWRKGVHPSVEAATSDLDVPKGGPALNGLDAPAVQDLRARKLAFPVEGLGPESLMNSFGDRRGGGTRLHRAVDILAPRRTPVRAVEAGTVARLDVSAAGGISVYQFDPDERYCYYYAHLDAYAPGLSVGAKVERGQLLGYVGTTGNAPRGTPHLHFAIYRLSDAKQWWAGTALNPYTVFR